MDPKDKPGAYNPCGVSPDPLAPATLAGRDSTHQLPAISASDSASTIIAWMIAGLTTPPLAVPITRSTSSVPYSAAGTSSAPRQPGINAPIAAATAETREKADMAARPAF